MLRNIFIVETKSRQLWCFKTLFFPWVKPRKTPTNTWKNLSCMANLDSYSNRMFFWIIFVFSLNHWLSKLVTILKVFPACLFYKHFMTIKWSIQNSKPINHLVEFFFHISKLNSSFKNHDNLKWYQNQLHLKIPSTK